MKLDYSNKTIGTLATIFVAIVLAYAFYSGGR